MSGPQEQDAPEIEVQVCNLRGLHARASARLASAAQGFDARITITARGETVAADSIMDLLMLAAAKGTRLRLHAQGPQASEALAAIKALIEDGFGEEI